MYLYRYIVYKLRNIGKKLIYQEKRLKGERTGDVGWYPGLRRGYESLYKEVNFTEPEGIIYVSIYLYRYIVYKL